MFVMFWTFLQHGGGYGLGTRSPGVLERQNKAMQKGRGPLKTLDARPGPPPAEVDFSQKAAPVAPGIRWGDDQPGCPLRIAKGCAPLPVTLNMLSPLWPASCPFQGVTGVETGWCTPSSRDCLFTQNFPGPSQEAGSGGAARGQTCGRSHD